MRERPMKESLQASGADGAGVLARSVIDVDVRVSALERW